MICLRMMLVRVTFLQKVTNNLDKNCGVNNIRKLYKENLFAMMDYFLTQNETLAEAEMGFSVLKGTKNSKRATLTNRYLCNQMRVMLSGKSLEQFYFEQPINIWLGLTSTRRINKEE